MIDGRCHLALLLSAACLSGCKSNTIVDGQARFQLLTPSLIRLEFADDRHFDDEISFNRVDTKFPPVRYTTRIRDGWREIETDDIRLRYLRGSGPYNRENLTVELLHEDKPPLRPFGGAPADSLGGWLRALDAQGDPVAMHAGLLNRDGVFILDDTLTAVERNDWIEPRAPHVGYYGDKLLFAYGRNYTNALADLTQLSGRPPLLPRWAFGIWYSRYFAHGDDDYRKTIVPRFRSEEVPLDVLVVDTDWKAPSGTDGWSWNTKLFPDGKGFLQWATSQGLHVTLNIHPSIAGTDPLFSDTDKAAGGLPKIGDNEFSWDWGDAKQAATYFALHQPFEDSGVRFWWFDWCCTAAYVNVPGADEKSKPELVPPDSWINALYARRATKRGLRGFAFGRIGGKWKGYSEVGSSSPTGPWPDRRTTIHFTGDTFPTWQMLGYEVGFTIAEGSTGFPYVSHDLGSFFGKHLPEDLYLRWVQLGTFQPIFRLHSNHGDRLPWDYGDSTRVAAEKFMRLRESLVPYLYTLGREAFDTGLPMVRGLYLAFPDEEDAYVYGRREYLLGDALLVMPIASADGKLHAWFPPGTWIDIFNGERVTGPKDDMLSAASDAMPVYARAGAIVPRQPPMSHVGERAVDPLLVDVYTGADGAFSLYEDEGEGLKYLQGKLRHTPMHYLQAQHALTIAPAEGQYDGAPAQRAYEVAFFAVDAAPSRVTVDGAALPSGQWHFDPTMHAVQVKVPEHAVDKKLEVQLQ